MSVPVPTPGGLPYVTDGGLETDLIYNRGFDLEEFAAFPLVYDDQDRAALGRLLRRLCGHRSPGWCRPGSGCAHVAGQPRLGWADRVRRRGH